jgi:hypothetical protein
LLAVVPLFAALIVTKLAHETARATGDHLREPAVAIVLGAIELSEPATLGMVIGFPLVIVGSVLGTSRAREDARPELAPARD